MKRTSYKIVSEDGKYGLKGSDGTVVAPCRYDKILDYDDDGYIRVLIGDVYGTLDLRGHEVIPHSLGLTHLGVFHGGTARARRDGLWGLVDEKGTSVGGFRYRRMEAHRPWGYLATTAEGQPGAVDEAGHFTTGAAGTAIRSKIYPDIGAAHDGICAARTYEYRWIFINKDGRRIGSYEYRSLNPVLRDGLYSAMVADHAYTAVHADGTPINDETYAYPLHFHNGLAECSKLHLDPYGKEITRPGGQPLYDHGILTDKGSYLFPPVYYELHPNDFKKRDCWYAEDDHFSYLLYPNGFMHIYRKLQAVKDPLGLHFIPPAEVGHALTPQEADALLRRPKVVYTGHPRVLDTEQFLNNLRQYTGGNLHDLSFYYRDTDAPIDADKLYPVGRIIRCGAEMEVSQKLLRPIRRTRFLIATEALHDVAGFARFHHLPPARMPFEGYVVGRNQYFIVVDVFHYGGVTQILLLRLPHDAITLARAYGLKLTPKLLMPVAPHYEPLLSYARHDLAHKMAQPIHGHSLSDRWIRKMYQPIGLDSELKPVSLTPDKAYTKDANKNWGTDWRQALLYELNFDVFVGSGNTKLSDSAINVVLGSMENLVIDTIVQFQPPTPDAGGTLSLTLTAAKGRHYQKILRYPLPALKGSKPSDIRQIEACYKAVLRFAGENDIPNLALPCIPQALLPTAETAAAPATVPNVLTETAAAPATAPNVLTEDDIVRTAVRTAVTAIRTGLYKGDIYLCSTAETTIERCENQLRRNGVTEK